MPFKDTKEGSTNYCESCEKEARSNVSSSFHTCGKTVSVKKIKKDKLTVLDEDVSAKLIKLSRKYPVMCANYLIEMHKVITWAEGKLKKIK